ncbi:MAG: hypothetical protein JRN09_07380 [Nitrososphaerota archaeon]|jgi:hypothetical protein|nr:hypothetical protein [Nitrososphaerota archaeon]
MTKRELATFEDFRKARLDDVGFIVMVDASRSPVVHRLNGRCISADNFRNKMARGGAGKYYQVDSVSDGIKELGASVCKLCKPLKPEKEPWKR